MSPLTDALNRIMAWLQQNCPACTLSFQPGLSPEQVASRLGELLFRVPREVYELYQWRNGDDRERPIFVYHYLLELDAALGYSQGINYFDLLEGREADGEPLYLFPIFHFEGEYFAVVGSDSPSDASPVFHIADDASVGLAFTSLTNMMLTIAECYETDVYAVISDGDIEITDGAKFERIRLKHDPGLLEPLYRGW
jgi:hypothetical protein